MLDCTGGLHGSRSIVGLTVSGLSAGLKFRILVP